MRKLFLPFRLPSDIKTLTAMSFRNKGHMLLTILNKIALAVYGKTREPIVRGTVYIVRRLYVIYSKQGMKGLVSFMKTCSVITQQTLGGHVLPSLTPLNTRVSRGCHGFPRIIPRIWRARLLTSPLLAKYCLSIFALYRFLLFDSPVKVKAITDPYKGNSTIILELTELIPSFFSAMSKYSDFITIKDETELRQEEGSKLFSVLTKGPTTFPYKGDGGLWSSHIISILRAYIILHQPRFSSTLESLKIISQYFNTPAFAEIERLFALKDINLPVMRETGIDMRVPASHHLWPEDLSKSFLGKLGLKQEAAGKMRVFAMVDPFTQWILHPIHKIIFDTFLKNIPMDGTFNQLKPLNASRNWKVLYSLDLSSATDRLPVELQGNIIDYMFPGLKNPWITSLVERPYYNPESKTGVTYAVGQPMGAYSSWAMLAVTHHFIVQCAAWQAGVVATGTPFEKYAVLGDDVVIGNSKVAKQYLNIIGALGVECGLHKSLLSPSGTALEFAKRTWHLGRDVSPITVRDLAASLLAIPNLVQFGNNHGISLPALLKIAGYGYKVIGGLNKPFHKLNLVVRNFIIAQLIPSNLNHIGELFGRSALSKWSWEPQLGEPILALFRAWARADIEKLTSYVWFSEDAYMKGADPCLIPFTRPEQEAALNELIQLYYAEFDEHESGILACITNPLDVFKTYLRFAAECTSIRGMSACESPVAKAAIDPKFVAQWKSWNKVISLLTPTLTAQSANQQMIDTDKMKFSSFFMVPFTLRSLRTIKVMWNTSPSLIFFLRSGSYVKFLTIFYPVTSFILYVGEWIALLSGLTLVAVSLAIVVNPEFFVVTLVPQLLSVLGTAHTAALLGGLGVQHEIPLTWLEWFSWLIPHWYSPVTGTVHTFMCIADYLVSTIVWWNTFLYSGIKGMVGLFGLWATVKVLSVIKLIWAHTQAALLFMGLSHLVAVLGTFITQALVICFMDPLMILYDNFSLPQLMWFLIPDPAGVWNLIVSINVLPWALLESAVHALTTGTFVSSAISTILAGWNVITSDLTFFGLDQVLHINNPHQVGLDFITHVLGPLDQRLGNIMRSVQNLRGIWR